MTQVTNNPGEFSIGSLNDSTGWIDNNSTIEDIAFNITGVWSGTIGFQVSNQSDFAKTRYSTVTSYTANQAPLNIPREIGRYFRFIFTSYASGTAYIGLSKGINAEGQLMNLVAQDNPVNPSGQFA